MPKLGMEPVRKQQLIEATLDSVYQYGLADTTLQRISEKAGVSPGIIAHYFGRKEDLLEATMRAMLTELGRAVVTRQQTAVSPREKLHAIIEGNFDFEQIHPRAATTWLAFWAEALHKPRLGRLQRINQYRLRNNLRYWLKKLLGEPRARSASDGLAAMIDGLWLRGAFEPGGIDPKRCTTLAREYLEKQLD